jgi:WD40 repeat protein
MLAVGSSKRLSLSKNPPDDPTRNLRKKEQSLPYDDRINPFANIDLPTAKCERLKNISSIKAHTMAISGYNVPINICRIKFHPKKSVLATVSDDKAWKMWAFPSGELIMSGEGHKDWIADCDFHPRFVSLIEEETNWLRHLEMEL